MTLRVSRDIFDAVASLLRCEEYIPSWPGTMVFQENQNITIFSHEFHRRYCTEVNGLVGNQSVAVIICNSRLKVLRHQPVKIGNEAFLEFLIPNKLILWHWTLSLRCNHNLQPTNAVFRSLFLLMVLRQRCIAIKYNDTSSSSSFAAN